MVWLWLVFIDFLEVFIICLPQYGDPSLFHAILHYYGGSLSTLKSLIIDTPYPRGVDNYDFMYKNIEKH